MNNLRDFMFTSQILKAVSTIKTDRFEFTALRAVSSAGALLAKGMYRMSLHV